MAQRSDERVIARRVLRLTTSVIVVMIVPMLERNGLSSLVARELVVVRMSDVERNEHELEQQRDE